jgi:hypothetical protein
MLPHWLRFSYAHTLLCAKCHIPCERLPGKVPLAWGCSGLLIGAIFRSGRGRGQARAVQRHRIKKLEPALLAWDVSSSLDQVHQGCFEDGPMLLAQEVGRARGLVADGDVAAETPGRAI